MSDATKGIESDSTSRGSWLLGLGRRLAFALWNDPRARQRAWIAVVSLLVCAYSISVLTYVLATPEIGVRCAFTPVVNHFYPEFLYPERQTALQEGDRILAVGGQPVETWSQLLRKTLLLRDQEPRVVAGITVDDLFADSGCPAKSERKVLAGHDFLRIDDLRVVRVVYERGEGEAATHGVVWCQLGRSPLTTFLPSILWFSLNIGLFVVGALGYWKRPDDRPAARFFWLCTLSLGAFVGGYHWAQILTQPVLLVVFMTCAVLLPAVSLHFNLVFPRSRPFFEASSKGWLLVIYGLPTVFMLLLFLDYLAVRRLDGGGGAGLLAGFEGVLGVGTDDSSRTVRFLLVRILSYIYLCFAIAALWFLAGIACLVRNYATAVSVVERNQVKWILLGSLAAILPIGYTLYLAIWEQGRFGAGAGTWPMFMASACITLAYTVSITRYRLLQLDQLISSGVVYFLISTAAGLVYYGVVLGSFLLVGSHPFEGPTLAHVLGVCGTALVLMIVLDVARGRILRAVDRHFRREKYQLDRTLQSLEQTIERLVDAPTLARQLLHTTTGLLSAPAGSVYLCPGEESLYRLTCHTGETPPLAELSSGCPLVEALRTQGTQRLDPIGHGPASRQLAFLHGAMAQSLTHENRLLGFLVLAPRIDGPYTIEDVQVLSAFARLSVLALVSAEGHRTIDLLNRDLKTKVEKIAEQQRRILALQSQLTRREGHRESTQVVTPPEPAEPVSRTPLGGLVGSGPEVRQLLQLVRRVAVSSSAVLLRGESGTGKELLARALHDCSPRAGKAFIKVHCAALSPGLLESELFGHVKGAYTSAIRDRVGRFESADGGTLFLDEIGDISLEVQTKLLRVLEEMTFERVGSSEPVQVDVRIIAATHRDLEAMIVQGAFREDLYFRLNVLPIRVPPLRQRVEDIPELAQHFLELYAAKLGKPVRLLDDDALVAMKSHPWPGNVRQLENVIERAVVVADGGVIGLDALPAEIRNPPPDAGISLDDMSLPELAEAFHADRDERDRRQREQLVRALASAGGNKAVAARALGLARSTLLSRLRKHGLS